MSDTDSIGRRRRPPLDAWQETNPRRMEEDRTWEGSASCRAHPQAKIFFSNRGDTRSTHRAKVICAECPVWRNCLDYSRRLNIEYGVWGGMSPADRDLLYKARRVDHCKKCGLIRIFFTKAETSCDTCRGVSLAQRRKAG